MLFSTRKKYVQQTVISDSKWYTIYSSKEAEIVCKEALRFLWKTRHHAGI